MHDEAFRGHADLALIHESAKSRGFDCLVQIGIFQHDEGRLAAQFQQHWLQMLCGLFGDDLADMGRAGEIDAADRRMGDKGRDDFRCVLRCIGNDIDHTGREASIVECLDDQVMNAGAGFGRTQNNRIAAGKCCRYGAHAENDRRIPRRHAKHHTNRLAHGHGNDAGFVRRNDLAGNLCGERCGFAQHTGPKMDVEARPWGRCTGFFEHETGEFVGPAFHQVRCLVQKRTTLVRAGFRPVFKGFRGRFRNRIDIGEVGRRRGSSDFSGDRVLAVEGPARCGCRFLAVDDEADCRHGLLPVYLSYHGIKAGSLHDPYL